MFIFLFKYEGGTKVGVYRIFRYLPYIWRLTVDLGLAIDLETYH